MAVANIDTLQAYKELVASGVPEKQAEAQVNLLKSSLDGLATKDDLERGLNNLEKDLKDDIKILEHKIDLKFNMIGYLGSAMVTIVILPIIDKFKEMSVMTVGIGIAVMLILSFLIKRFNK